MITAVQERIRGDRATARVVYGDPTSRKRGKHGPVCLFASDVLVAYRVTAGSAVRGFVFRTLRDGHEPLSSRLAGVTPSVRLLMMLRGRRQLERAIELLRHVEQQAAAPAMVDAPLVRIGPSLMRRASVMQLWAAIGNDPVRTPWTF
jgi:hypothetical protein